MKAISEREVQSALRSEALVSASRPTGDFVDGTLQFILDPESCPKCKRPYQVCTRIPHPHVTKVYTPSHANFQHTGGCAAMHCTHCMTHFCLWCRKIILADEKHRDASAHTHSHVLDCMKGPLHDEILTQSVLFPVNVDAEVDFLVSLFQIRRLEAVQLSMAQGAPFGL